MTEKRAREIKRILEDYESSKDLRKKVLRILKMIKLSDECRIDITVYDGMKNRELIFDYDFPKKTSKKFLQFLLKECKKTEKDYLKVISDIKEDK